MDLVLSKRNSALFRPGSQKPTFVTANDEPTRYYDFAETPALLRPSSPLIDRQEIPADVEAKVRYACSLLVYRIERGVGSFSQNQPSSAVSREGPVDDVPLKAQLQSKYIAPRVGREAAALKGKYDSGVGLTQQPSVQTMRVAYSRSGEPSESEDNLPGSIFSNSRTGTSCSNTSAAGTTEQSCRESSIQSPMPNGMQLMAGGDTVMGYVQQQDHDTKTFLGGLSKLGTSADYEADDDDDASEDMEVFLNPDAGSIDLDRVQSISSPQVLLNSNSPSLGIFRESRSTRQSIQNEPNKERHSPLIGLGASGLASDTQKPGVIIDSRGYTHILTATEETQRNIDLQQAVIAKMNTGNIEPSPALPKLPQHPPKAHQKIPHRPRSSASRLKSSWSSITRPKTPSTKQNPPVQSHSTAPSNNQSVLKRLANFFLAERNNPPSRGK